MTYAVSAGQMREAERSAIEGFKIPPILLMENAALRTAEHITSSCVIFCGKGNNGGDGLALARQLYAKNIETAVVLTGEPVTDEALLNLRMVKNMGINVLNYPSDNSKIKEKTDGAEIIVDALFGTGLTRPVDGIYRELIDLINSQAKRVVSLDIPSGLNADTGHPLGAAVKADITVAYGYAKTGLLLYPGALYAGEVVVEGISLPQNNAQGYVRIIDGSDLKTLMPVRNADSNKGSHGRVCAVAGSALMPGAAVLACMAAYRAGAGLVDACTVPEAANVVHSLLPEAVTSLRPQFDESAAKASVLLVGPGLGADSETRILVSRALKNSTCPVVLDADGLNAVAEMGTDLLNSMKVSCVITPHPKEMSGLTGLSVSGILSDPLRIARDFSAKHGVHVLLKGARTVIASPDGKTFINTSGCSALAKAGTGDVLAGVISGLLAQGVGLPEAAALGAYLHGRAGEKAAKKIGEYAVNARDVIADL